jgi:GNAT superfamily N-acetyltransferase
MALLDCRVVDRGRWGDLAALCFFVHRDHRGQGAHTEMLEAPLDLVGDRGAWVVEAYPVLPDSPSYRFMGLVETFERAGFEHRGLAGTRRHVMSRWLTQ